MNNDQYNKYRKEASSKALSISTIVSYIFDIIRPILKGFKVIFAAHPKKVWIPPATRAKMTEVGVTEVQVMDVFYRGTYKRKSTGAHSMTRKYGNYEIGLYYEPPIYNKEYRILTVWKDRL